MDNVQLKLIPAFTFLIYVNPSTRFSTLRIPEEVIDHRLRGGEARSIWRMICLYGLVEYLVDGLTKTEKFKHREDVLQLIVNLSMKCSV